MKRPRIAVCFFVEYVALTTSDEMCVVGGSPRKNATLPAMPKSAPADGFAPITGVQAFIGSR